ncbi:LCP family protein [Umezawaea endophytica]|uniref:LCP family protein n=1 Tax=Umezawaea endophytica TaxID=1654476 RepID=A0A9X3A401_9PSEU|nr:LCP family protein [Umezawaea endophytica]MCS7480688.1 LCP family protein [Umezawaea endophytica]
MTDQEALIREAIAAEADETVDARAVLAAVHAKRSRRRPLALLAAAGITVAAVVAAVVVSLPTPPAQTEELEVATPVEPRTVLLAGLDDSGRTDSVVLARVGVDGSVDAVSLPRDSWLDIPGRGMGKLNSAYVAGEVGEPQDLVRAVEAVTGVRVDHYATVDLAAVAAVSAVVGGVEVCLTAPASDEYSGVDLPAGRSTVSGDQALAFLRQRHGLPNSDLDRVVRQQAFLRSLAAKLLDPAVLRDQARVTAVLGALEAGVHTDPGWNLLAFTATLTPNATVDTTTVPHGQATEVEGTYALPLDPTTVRAFVAEFLSDGPRPTNQPGPPSDGCVN